MPKLTKAKRIKRAFEIICHDNKAKTPEGDERLAEIQINIKGYAEPGYTSKHGIIATGNWNAISKWKNDVSEVVDDVPVLVGDQLEKLGIDLEWNDEWKSCCECGKLVRTQENSYGWKRSYYMNDDGVVCHQCVRKNPKNYLKYLQGNNRDCLTIDLDLKKYGYVLLEDGFENGLHGGQTADPKVIAASLKKQNVKNFIFRLDEKGQFDIKFSVYIHKDEISKLNKEEYDCANKSCQVDPLELMKRGLASASLEMGKLNGRIKVATIVGDKAIARVVSPKDFANGKAFHE